MAEETYYELLQVSRTADLEIITGAYRALIRRHHPRGTAGGMFDTSGRAGGVVGASAGGLMLSLGGFPAVGLLCLVATVLSASVAGLLMRRSPAFRLGGAGT